jgi:hypothetical protein
MEPVEFRQGFEACLQAFRFHGGTEPLAGGNLLGDQFFAWMLPFKCARQQVKILRGQARDGSAGDCIAWFWASHRANRAFQPFNLPRQPHVHGVKSTVAPS